MPSSALLLTSLSSLSAVLTPVSAAPYGKTPFETIVAAAQPNAPFGLCFSDGTFDTPGIHHRCLSNMKYNDEASLGTEIFINSFQVTGRALTGHETIVFEFEGDRSQWQSSAGPFNDVDWNDVASDWQGKVTAIHVDSF